MTGARARRWHSWTIVLALTSLLVGSGSRVPAQQSATETRDPRQTQDEEFARLYAQWTGATQFGSPLVDHLPRVPGVPSPKDVLGYHAGAPGKLTYYADLLRYYRALAAATPRVKVESIGKSDENRELVVVWVSSDENIRTLQRNRDNLARIADPRGRSDAQIRELIATTKPHYHLIGGVHSHETGPSEMMMELAYRLATESSPLVTQIRNNVIVSITPAAEPDGRDRNVDWVNRRQEEAGGASGGAVPYTGKYVYRDYNRDTNLSQPSTRALTDWYFTAHPPIVHDLHESAELFYTYSGAAPQNPNLDPLLFAELPWFSNWEMAQMTKWGMPGVFTHAFMDAWSPGYLGSVAYNHNGMMRMYETQAGRDAVSGGLGTENAGEAAEGAAAPTTSATGGVPTGRGGSQPREWYRGIPVPPNAAATFSRRNSVNYAQTGLLSALQLTSMFPNVIIENFYVKTRNSIEAGRAQPPYAYVIPVQREMTRVVTLVNMLGAQGIEVGTAIAEVKAGNDTFPAGSYVIKLDQPYGRLAKNLLERQNYPDPALRTSDDSGWTMGLAMNVEVKEVRDRTVLAAATTLVNQAEWRGTVTGTGAAGLAVAHLGSTNMIAFRYRLKDTSMAIADRPFTASGVEFPAGSFIVTGTAADLLRARAAVESLGLTAAALASLPSVSMHNGRAPRVAIYSQWSGTQDLGWYRFTFDKLGVPFDLIYKERVVRGDLRADYDVIVMAAQNLGRGAVLAAPAARPQPYQKNEKYKSLGMYGETPDMSGGFGPAGVEAFARFLEADGTVIAAHSAAVRFPIVFGFAKSIDSEPLAGVNAQRPLVQAEIVRSDHPVFYGYADRIFPVKFGPGQLVFRVGAADQGHVLAQFVGGNDSVLSGVMVGADALRQRAFAVDVPNAHNGKGRVIMFANNPVYRWQNHGEFNMVFNAILNWNHVPSPAPIARTR